MPDCLIFSRDRPAQLEMLLDSIDRFAPGYYDELTVLYYPTGEVFATGYKRLRDEWRRSNLIWIEEGVFFEADVRKWLESPLRMDLVSFLCDDDVFYRPAKPGPPPWSLRGGDYDYPFSVDGNVYELYHVKWLLKELPFQNPTELEWFAHEHRTRLPFHLVNPCKPPCLTGVPLNRVADIGDMPHEHWDTLEMTERYLDGQRLRMPDVQVDLPAHSNVFPSWQPAASLAA